MDKVRVSVANLVTTIVSSETDDTACKGSSYIGILNRMALEQGQRILGAIGGAVELTEHGRNLLQKNFGASEFEGPDARFQVDEVVVEDVLNLLVCRNPTIFEISIKREIEEELGTVEISGQNNSILNSSETQTIATQYVETKQQRSELSIRTKGMPTYRIFHLFEMMVPITIYKTLDASPFIEIFDERCIEETEDGKTVRGVKLGSNIVL